MPSTEVRAFERGYVSRAREAVGDAADDCVAVALDRHPPAGALGGWWVDREQHPDTVVLPNPWDDRGAIAAHEHYAWELTRRLCARIAPVLDDVHATTHGERWWALVLDAWLLHVVAVVVDRRLFMLTSAAVAPSAPVLVDESLTPPATLADGVNALLTDAGQRALCAAIARATGRSVTPMTARARDDAAVVNASMSARAKAGLALRHGPDLLVRAALGRLPGRRIALVGQTLTTSEEVRALIRRVPGLRPAPVLLGAAPTPPPADLGLRERLEAALSEGPASADPVEAMARRLIGRLLPRSVLEGFPVLARAARRRYCAPCDVAVGGHAADDVRNVFLADCVAAGHRLTFIQHGGFYLQGQVNSQDRLEIREGSTFLSWGGRGSHVAALPSPYPTRLRDAHRSSDERIVMVESLPPSLLAYLVRFASMPLGNQAYGETRLLARFTQAADPLTHRRLVLKRFPLPAGDTRPAALEALPAAAPGNAVAWLRHARMAVIGYPDTPFVEAMALGVPTIGLWTPALWELRPDAEEPFAALRDAGVIFADPLQAAAQVDDVHGRAAAWWRTPTIVSARALFLERFALAGDWRGAWAAHLRPRRAPGGPSRRV